MKKLVSIIAIGAAVLTFTGCGSEKKVRTVELLKNGIYKCEGSENKLNKDIYFKIENGTWNVSEKNKDNWLIGSDKMYFSTSFKDWKGTFEIGNYEKKNSEGNFVPIHRYPFYIKREYKTEQFAEFYKADNDTDKFELMKYRGYSMPKYTSSMQYMPARCILIEPIK